LTPLGEYRMLALQVNDILNDEHHVSRTNVAMELRLARKIARLTQEELARQAGVTDAFICMLESGRRKILNTPYKTVVRIARALHVEPDELFPVEDAPAWTGADEEEPVPVADEIAVSAIAAAEVEAEP
jgi:transcriptional regulator with XRE-family HTH domain